MISYDLWMQKDGSKISVNQMTNLHIKNTIKALQRKVEHINSDEIVFEVDLSEYKERIGSWIDVFKKEYKSRKMMNEGGNL